MDASAGLCVDSGSMDKMSKSHHITKMKVLIACEFSGIVRDAFIQRGHDAVSCDLLPTTYFLKVR